MAIWGILTMITLTKPPARTMLVVFSPFLLLGAALSWYSVQNPSSSTEDAWLWSIISMVVWFGLLAYAYFVHEEPTSGSLL